MQAICLKPTETIEVSEIKSTIHSQLLKLQNFKNELEDIRSKRSALAKNIEAELTALNIAPDDDKFNRAFSSFNPPSLHQFSYSIARHAASHNLTYANKFQENLSDVDYTQLNIDDIEPIVAQELIDINREFFPESINTTEQFPSSYVVELKKFFSENINSIIKDLWNICLTLTNSSFQLKKLAETPLGNGEYITPFFKIKILNLGYDEMCDQICFKARIDFSPEMLVILETHKALFTIQNSDMEF